MFPKEFSPSSGQNVSYSAGTIPMRMLHRYLAEVFNASIRAITIVGEQHPELKTEVSNAVVELDHLRDSIGTRDNFSLVTAIRGLTKNHKPLVADEIQRLQIRAHKVQDNNAILALKIYLTDLMHEQTFKASFYNNPEAKLALHTAILDAIVPEQISKALKTFSNAIQWHHFTDTLKKICFLTSKESSRENPLQHFLEKANASIDNYVMTQQEFQSPKLV
jgi:hypothetical protein